MEPCRDMVPTQGLEPRTY